MKYKAIKSPLFNNLGALSLFGLTGTALLRGDIQGILWVFIFLLALVYKIKMEEGFPEKAFKNYDAYRNTTPMLVPLIW